MSNYTGSEPNAGVWGAPGEQAQQRADLSFMSGCISRDLEKSLGFVIPAGLSHPVLMLLAASPPQPCPWPQEGKERIAGSILH